MPRAHRELHLRRFLPYVAAAILLGVGLCLRLIWYPITTSDYTYFVAVWFHVLATHPGLSAFAQPFSDYAPLYLYLLKLLTCIPSNSLVLAKILSFLFDIAIAGVAVALARVRSPRQFERGELFLVFAIFLSIPTVMLNSSLWGQSDALYAAPIMLCLYWILGDRPVLAAIAFGVAISFKAQAIFFLPVLFGYLWGGRATRRYLLIPPAIFLASVIPAVAAGGNPSYWFLIYLKEAGEYPYLSVSAPTVFAFLNGLPLSSVAESILFWIGVALALSWAAIVARAARFVRGFRPATTVALSLSSVLILPYVLPRMHERYFFLADVLSCVWALFAFRRWYLAVLIVGASLLSYMPYLSSQVPFLSRFSVDLRIPALLLLIAIGIVLARIRRLIRKRPDSLPSAMDDASAGARRS